ncbi:hypothetical protein MP228_005730 [Amoeboaphelidium protococcarum]|nr:hypothetical protein MP228_005730 [Amoeboaphelidium protococcarum]
MVKYTRTSDDSEAYYQFFAKTDFRPYINRYITVKQLLLESNFVICQHCSRDVDVFRTSELQLCTDCYAAYNRRTKSSIDKENIPDGELAQFTLDPTINTNGHTGPDQLVYDKATTAGGDSGRALVCLFGKSGNAGENKIQPDFGLAATLANKLVEARLEWSEDNSIMLPRERTYKLVGRYHGNGMLAKKSAIKDYRTYANVPYVVQQWNVQDEDYILLTGLHPAAFGTGNPLYLLKFLFAVSLLKPPLSLFGFPWPYYRYAFLLQVKARLRAIERDARRTPNCEGSTLSKGPKRTTPLSRIIIDFDLAKVDYC